MLTRERGAALRQGRRRISGPLRCHLHYLRDRAEDKLTFDSSSRSRAAWATAITPATTRVERLMKHYFLTAKSVGELTRFFCTAVEAQQMQALLHPPAVASACASARSRASASMAGGCRCRSANHFEKHPLDLLRIFAVAQKHDLDIQPMTFTWIARRVRASTTARRIRRPTRCSWRS